MFRNFTRLARARRIPSVVLRVRCAGVDAAMEGLSNEKAIATIRELDALVGGVALSAYGVAFRFDIADFVIAIPEDQNPACRMAACGVALRLRGDMPDFFASKQWPLPLRPDVGLAIGIDYGPLFWASALGNPALGAVVSGASRLAQLAASQKITTLASAAVVEAIIQRVDCAKRGEMEGRIVYEVKDLVR